MEKHSVSPNFGTRFSQVGLVVKDIQAAEKIFQEVLGVSDFAKMENIRAEDTEGTYLGQPGNFVFHLYMGYSGDSMLELIQPVSGQSIYQDYLEKHPEGGVQHIAFSVLEEEFDKTVSELSNKGYSIIQDLTLPVAKVAYFDTYKEIGVATEIIGVTKAGLEFVNQLKSKVNADLLSEQIISLRTYIKYKGYYLQTGT
ncbi:VOC family protein [Adhaeribacter radiodurans]|uniref:VOC family protein n=1 Tax=Adhaeribacter radiodurans TaxID=2745197 RepID=A0A7L7L7G6_9BACT|nr:VOC family protein [Adhaeribacter radiodurans]QMU28694.1 VOC family protein [Adhaeribacter radiodurans]